MSRLVATTPVTVLQSAADARLNWVTPGLRAKLQDRKPIFADLARLSWIESVVRGGLLLWIDADTLVVDPWHMPDWTHTSLGGECWFQPMAE